MKAREYRADHFLWSVDDEGVATRKRMVVEAGKPVEITSLSKSPTTH